jgi:RNA polymerase sigma factor (sigma-70 family)
VDLGDGDLVRLAREGDPVAFRLLVERHQDAARARAAALGHDRHEVDDIVQESFLQAFISLERLRDPDRFAAWLGGIVLNVHRALGRRTPLTLVADWPERLHPESADGLPSADDLDRADAVRAAVAALPPGQRHAVELYYYADQPASQVAVSPGAAKVSLHKARRHLRDYIAEHRPDLIPMSTRRIPMTAVRIARAEPLPGHRAGSGFRFDQVLVVLADDAGHRALPIWLRDSDGESLWRLLEPPAGGAGTADAPAEDPAEALTARLLAAARLSVTGVDVDELGPEVTAARIGLAGPAGPADVAGRLGHGLALAAATGAPVRVATGLMDRMAVPMAGGDLLAPFLGRGPESAPVGPRARRRFEPRNLDFAAGLDWWDFGGSFRRAARGGGRGQPAAGGSHWADYHCTAGDHSVVLASAVAEPYGTAFLRQAIFADDYRGATVSFRAEIRTSDVSGQAGLGVWISEGQVNPFVRDDHDDREGHTVAMAGTTGWTAYEVTAEVADDAQVVRFGVFLTGRGRVEVRGAALTGA